MVLEFLATGFEEIEALTPVDVLRRAGVELKTVAIGVEGKTVAGAHGINVSADLTADEALALDDKIEMIILPGGMPGAKNLDESAVVDEFVNRASGECAYIASICAAPMIPGKRGLLCGKRAVCYPGFEEYLDGAILTGGRVEGDGNMITACGMGAALEFALLLVKLLKGENAACDLKSAVLAQ
ncbi:MAG: DJ-1/PfpI family protein [Ruminococcaceae bacterium]|nr:DJ-1/PfpI family protein [Oscillospiraceae bacterium]